MLLDVKNPSQAQVDALHIEWAKDAKMDRLEPSQELKKIGSLHAKYLNILSAHRRAFKEGERRYAKLRKVKYEYYMGRLDQSILVKYNWPPFPFTLKGDLSTYMDSDGTAMFHAPPPSMPTSNAAIASVPPPHIFCAYG